MNDDKFKYINSIYFVSSYIHSIKDIIDEPIFDWCDGYNEMKEQLVAEYLIYQNEVIE